MYEFQLLGDTATARKGLLAGWMLAMTQWSRWQSYAFIIAITLATLVLRLSFGFTQPPLLSLFILPIGLAAYLRGFAGGCVATLVALLGAEYYLLDPVHSLLVTNLADGLNIGVFLLTGLAFSALIQRLQTVAKQCDARERALREQWDHILRISPAAICSFRRDLHGQVNFPFSTPTIKEFYGIEPAQLAADGEAALSLFNPQDAQRIQDSIVRSAKGLTPFREQWRVNHPAKGEIWVECHSTPLTQADGSTLWHGLLLDITQRKQAEAAIDRSRVAYQQIVNQLPQLVWTCGHDGVCDFLNERWVEFTGLSAEEQLGYGWLNQIHPDDQARVMEGWAAAVEQGTDFSVTYRLRRHDGIYHWFDTRANRICDEAGRVVKWFGSNTNVQVTHDLTERLVQQALLLDLSLEPILAWSLTGGIEFWNSGCEQCYGFSETDALGLTSHELLKTTMPESEPWFMDKLLQDGIWSGELIHKTKQGKTLNVLSRMQIVEREGRKLVLESNRDITARKASEEALRLWGLTFEQAGFGVVLTDATNNTFKAVNATYARERGYTPDELLGQSVFSVYPPDRVNETKRFVEAVDRQAHATFESEHLTKDGRRFPVWLDITVLKNRDGIPQSRIACSLDMTQRKAAEAALQASEARLKLFIEHAPAALAMFDVNLCFLAVSRRWLTDYELEGQDVLGRSHYALFPDIPEEWHVVHRRALAGEIMRNEKDLFVRPDGSKQWIRWEVRPWYMDSDIIGGIVIFAEDITERMAVEAALADSEFQHRSLLNALADGVFVAQDYQFVFANNALPVLLGYDIHEFIGSPFDRIILPEFLPTWCKRFAQRIGAGPEPQKQYELQVRCKNGQELWVELRASRTTYDGKPAVLGILHDISERKLIEEEFRALNLSLERRVAERTGELQAANQELESFAYAVSHDLRAPLRAMRGFSQALVEDYGPELNEEAQGYLEQIQKGSSHMADLIDGLLVLSRATRGDLVRSRVDLAVVAQLVLDELHRIEPERQVIWELGPGLYAWGDGRMLELVLRNLLSNAWKYTAKRATARIRFYATDTEQGQCFCVEDNGAGFEMKHAEKLFQPFQRLHRQDEFAGIGIGLATVQRIIHRHGGHIWAVSQPEHGASFYFQIPGNEDQ